MLISLFSGDCNPVLHSVHWSLVGNCEGIVQYVLNREAAFPQYLSFQGAEKEEYTDLAWWMVGGILSKYSTFIHIIFSFIHLFIQASTNEIYQTLNDMTSFQETRTERAAEIEPTDFASRLNVLVKAINVERNDHFLFRCHWMSVKFSYRVQQQYFVS